MIQSQVQAVLRARLLVEVEYDVDLFPVLFLFDINKIKNENFSKKKFKNFLKKLRKFKKKPKYFKNFKKKNQNI